MQGKRHIFTNQNYYLVSIWVCVSYPHKTAIGLVLCFSVCICPLVFCVFVSSPFPVCFFTSSRRELLLCSSLLSIWGSCLWYGISSDGFLKEKSSPSAGTITTLNISSISKLPLWGRFDSHVYMGQYSSRLVRRAGRPVGKPLVVCGGIERSNLRCGQWEGSGQVWKDPTIYESNQPSIIFQLNSRRLAGWGEMSQSSKEWCASFGEKQKISGQCVSSGAHLLES